MATATVEDFRIKSHAFLIELDAATMGMMTLVSSRCVSGPEWEEATKRHHDAYEIWNSFLHVTASGTDEVTSLTESRA
ncbi:hypothetical protein ACYZTX_13690 [Pseudomonas sp. MDT1-17]